MQSISEMSDMQEIGKDIFKKKNEISILRIPKIFEGLEIEKIVEEVIEDIKNEKIFTNVNTQVLRMLSYLSCKSAIKAGKYLTQEERKKLLYLLKTEDYIYTCPHGRPVQIELTMNRLNYLFKR
jgi:DNA mismatch repair protein MutL